jgi:putative copper export protein
MNFAILAVSYAVHLLSTAVWLGGLSTLVLVALPALRQQTLNHNQWLALQQRLTPWINGSLLLLLITGFVQMTNDEHYTGFLVFDGVWAWAMLFKHIAFVGMALITGYLQFVLHPEMGRTAVLLAQKPDLAAAEQATLHQKEVRLLWLNTACALLVLLSTAVMTAV